MDDSVEFFMGSDYCPACNGDPGNTEEHLEHEKWYYWFCFPGCLPDSEPFGPFDTAEEAEADYHAGECFDDSGSE